MAPCQPQTQRERPPQLRAGFEQGYEHGQATAGSSEARVWKVARGPVEADASGPGTQDTGGDDSGNSSPRGQEQMQITGTIGTGTGTGKEKQKRAAKAAQKDKEQIGKRGQIGS